ncbi:hypothetical protein RND81_06G098100 [Saponaria officinalis]|uniref:Uncharacterized protein n=1 Tax=Saponaria officinalis TaxID=3572 RepID=A0AAW1K9T2_SAPOF
MPPQKSTLFLITLLLFTHIHHTSAYIPSLTQIRSLFSLSHTLLSLSSTLLHRVATLRFSRADVSDALRAKILAGKLELLMDLRFWPTVFSLCWDLYRNYAWLETVSFKDKGEFNELMTRALSELPRVRNGSEWTAWVERNYENVRRVFYSVITRLHSVFTKSGPIKELVETLKEEMEEGDFIKDCLEVGAKDIRGLIQILKELSSPYTTADYKHEVEL